ncbi:MAG TPA: Hsp20/alpha crystallin family protein [Terriglobales bacterium]|nr:Hsp20/alpha crystallin family protein [Terriglobales bacterium]
MKRTNDSRFFTKFATEGIYEVPLCGRPRSQRLSEAGKTHLLQYMRQVRLKLEPDAVPFPKAEAQAETTYPAISVYEADPGYVVVAAVPGLERKDLEVSVEDSRLILQGKVPSIQKPSWTPTHVEYELASFRRDIDLPSALNEDPVQKQTLHNGLLTIELRKPDSPAAVASNRTGHIASIGKADAKA